MIKLLGLTKLVFSRGRQTIDNVIITQEVIHTLENSKSKKGGLVFKIDLEKAYDKISWNFLKNVLVNFNFNKNWINLIMSCVARGQTSILWNGQALPPFAMAKVSAKGTPSPPTSLCFALNTSLT